MRTLDWACQFDKEVVWKVLFGYMLFMTIYFYYLVTNGGPLWHIYKPYCNHHVCHFLLSSADYVPKRLQIMNHCFLVTPQHHELAGSTYNTYNFKSVPHVKACTRGLGWRCQFNKWVVWNMLFGTIFSTSDWWLSRVTYPWTSSQLARVVTLSLAMPLILQRLWIMKYCVLVTPQHHELVGSTFDTCDLSSSPLSNHRGGVWTGHVYSTKKKKMFKT